VSLVARLQQSLDKMGAEKMSLEDQIADLMKQVEADYNLFIFLIDDMVLNNYMGIFM
jgi:cell division protein FtsB